MKEYGPCTKCLSPWRPRRYWNGKYLIWYQGCSNCKNMSFWSGGET